MAKRPKKLNEIEQSKFGTKLSRNERIEKWRDVARWMEENLQSPICNLEKLPNGGVKIIIHPSHIEDTFNSIFVRFDDVAKAAAKILNLSPEEVEKEKQEWEAAYQRNKQRDIKRSINIFSARWRELTSHAVWNVYSLLQALTSAEAGEDLSEELGPKYNNFTRNEWADNLTYGYDLRVKKILGVGDPGRPAQSFEYPDQGSFANALTKALYKVAKNETTVNQTTICESLGIDRKTFKATCERFELDPAQLILDLKRIQSEKRSEPKSKAGK